MHRRTGNPLALESVAAARVYEDIDGLSGKMPAFDDNRARSELPDMTRSSLAMFGGLDRPVDEQAGLDCIAGHYLRERQQRAGDRLQHVAASERLSAAGLGYGIDNQRRPIRCTVFREPLCVQPFNARSDRLYDGRCREHPALDHCGLRCGQERIELIEHEPGLKRLDAVHARAVLNGD